MIRRRLAACLLTLCAASAVTAQTYRAVTVNTNGVLVAPSNFVETNNLITVIGTPADGEVVAWSAAVTNHVYSSAGAGDMQRAVYDPDLDGLVDAVATGAVRAAVTNLYLPLAAGTANPLSGALYFGPPGSTTVIGVDVTGFRMSTGGSTNIVLTPGGDVVMAPLGGDVTITGALAATSLAGAGSGITALNASALDSGTIPDGRFPAMLPAVDGSQLTNLPSAGIDGTTGTTANRALVATSTEGTLAASQWVLSSAAGSGGFLDLDFVHAGTSGLRIGTTGAGKVTISNNGHFTAANAIEGTGYGNFAIGQSARVDAGYYAGALGLNADADHNGAIVIYANKDTYATHAVTSAKEGELVLGSRYNGIRFIVGNNSSGSVYFLGKVASDPSTTNEGDYWYNTTTHTWRYYDGTSAVDF